VQAAGWLLLALGGSGVVPETLALPLAPMRCCSPAWPGKPGRCGNARARRAGAAPWRRCWAWASCFPAVLLIDEVGLRAVAASLILGAFYLSAAAALAQRLEERLDAAALPGAGDRRAGAGGRRARRLVLLALRLGLDEQRDAAPVARRRTVSADAAGRLRLAAAGARAPAGRAGAPGGGRSAHRRAEPARLLPGAGAMDGAGAPARPADRAGGVRPRRFQAHQRRLRPPGRRRGAAQAWPTPASASCATATCWDAWSAPNSRSCCRAPGWRTPPWWPSACAPRSKPSA
jgi:hypothetical protein